MNSEGLNIKAAIIDPVRNARIHWFKHPRTIFHYTTAEGLKGILTENILRCTRTDFLNDSSEMKHGADMFFERLQSAQGGPLFQKFQQHCHSFGREDFEKSRPVFVACLSQEGDNLDLWRGYGTTSPAYSLEFNVWGALFNTFGTAELLPAIYEDERKFDLVDAFIAQIKEQLESRPFAEFAADGSEGVLFNQIILHVWLAFPIMKHRGFESEREWRFVVRSDPQQENRIPATYVRKNLFVPYVPLDFAQSDFGGTPVPPIHRITIGPCPEPRLAEAGLTEFLRECKRQYIDVKLSQLPFRG